MPELRQPLSLKEIFGRIRQILLLKEDSTSTDAGKERQVEGRDGALKVFLEEDLGSESSAVKASLEMRAILEEQILPWLKVIAYHLGEMRDEHITPEDLDGNPR